MRLYCCRNQVEIFNCQLVLDYEKWFAHTRVLLLQVVKMFTKTNRDIRFSSVANGEDNDNDSSSSEYRFSKCETKLKRYKVTNPDEHPSVIQGMVDARSIQLNKSADSNGYYL